MASINEKLNYINETKSLIKDGLNGLGSEITNQTTFRDYADKIEDLYEEWPKIQNTDIALSLDNTKKSKIKWNFLKGNGKQERNIGKNMSPVNIKTLSGTALTSGSIGGIKGGILVKDIPFPADGIYVSAVFPETVTNPLIWLYNGKLNADSQNAAYVELYQGNRGIQTSYSSNFGKKISNSNNYEYIAISIGSSSTYEEGESVTFTVNDIMVSTTNDTFEPYASIQNIHLVTGDNTIHIHNKNLFNISNYGKYGWNISIDNPLKGMTAGDYTISCKNSSDQDMAIIFSNTQYTSEKIGEYFAGYNFGNTLSQKTTALTNEQLNATYLTFLPQDGYLTQEGLENMQIMIEKHSSKTNYETYQIQNYDFNLGNLKICKINNYQDYIYENNNKWYLKKKIQEYILPAINSLTSNTVFGQSCKVASYAIPNILSTGRNYDYFCNNVHYTKNSYEDTEEYFSQYGGYVNQSNFIVMTTNDDTLENFNSKINGSILYYPLAEEIDIEITDMILINKLNILKQAMSYDNQTNISQTNNDLPFVISASALLKNSN